MSGRVIASITTFFLIILLITVFHSAVAGLLGKAAFKEATTITSDSDLLLFCTLNEAGPEDMSAILINGLDVKFTFFVELYKTTKNWPDERIASTIFHHTISYDALKENYRVILEEQNNKLLLFKSLSDAQKTLYEVNGAKIVPLKQLIPDKSYKLMFRAELLQKSLPLSLNKIIPPLSWLDKATDWQAIEFLY